jgi:hypothetical protein
VLSERLEKQTKTAKDLISQISLQRASIDGGISILEAPDEKTIQAMDEAVKNIKSLILLAEKSSIYRQEGDISNALREAVLKAGKSIENYEVQLYLVNKNSDDIVDSLEVAKYKLESKLNNIKFLDLNSIKNEIESAKIEIEQAEEFLSKHRQNSNRKKIEGFIKSVNLCCSTIQNKIKEYLIDDLLQHFKELSINRMQPEGIDLALAEKYVSEFKGVSKDADEALKKLQLQISELEKQIAREQEVKVTIHSFFTSEKLVEKLKEKNLRRGAKIPKTYQDSYDKAFGLDLLDEEEITEADRAGQEIARSRGNK